ncbi:hypothetical protein NDU88_004837, partial [Pleurodeles waltl]
GRRCWSLSWVLKQLTLPLPVLQADSGQREWRRSSASCPLPSDLHLPPLLAAHTASWTGGLGWTNSDHGAAQLPPPATLRFPAPLPCPGRLEIW